MESSIFTLAIFMFAAFLCAMCFIYAYANPSVKELATANKNITSALKKTTDAVDRIDVLAARLTEYKISIQNLKEQVQALNEKSMSLGTKIEKNIVITHQWPEPQPKNKWGLVDSVELANKKPVRKK